MAELAHAVVSHIGIAGLAGLWIVKAGLGAYGLRWLRLRKKTRG